jgi:hypothetical protein
MSNNNQDLIEIVKDNQKTKRVMMAGMILQGAVSFLTMFILLKELFRQKKPSIKERMMREEEIIARAKLRLKRLKKEADYEAELGQLKSGLNSLDDLQEKGEEFVQNQAEQAKKGIGDKIKGFKDKFLNLDKDKKDKE